MPEKPDFIENPIDGSPLFRDSLKISGIIFIILVLYLIQYYSNTTDNKFIQDHDWKCSEYCDVGDWISFDTPLFRINNDTLFKHDTAAAIIITVDRAFFGDNELIIKSIKTGKLGVYHEK